MSGEPTDEILALGRQIGATEFVGGPGLPIERGYYRFQDLMLVRNRVQDAGLRYDVASMPEEWTYKIKLGLPGRDEQIDSWRRSIENMGAAGFKAIVYFFSLRSSIGPLRSEDLQSDAGTGRRKGHDLRLRIDQERQRRLLGGAAGPWGAGDRPAGLGTTSRTSWKP